MTILKQVRRFDLGKITSIEKTPQGFLKVPGFATRTGVFTYLDATGGVRRELRHPDDVFAPESLATLKNTPVTLDHPPVMLNPENVNMYLKGYTSDRVEVNRDLVETDLIIASQDAIDAVENQGMRELSSGYLADLDEVGGVYNGAQYDCRQVNIKYNHLAIVKRGRAGPEARLRLDSMDAVMKLDSQPANQFQTEGETDSDLNIQGDTKAVIISGQSIQLPTHIAGVVQDMMDRYDEIRGQLAKMKEETMSYSRKDVDVNQSGISPQVSVVQGPPDGRGAGKADEDEKGIVGGPKALGKDKDEDEKEKEDGENPFAKEKEKDDEDEPSETKLKKDIEEMEKKLDAMRAKKDALQGKLDAYASTTINPKMDSHDVVNQKVRLILQARDLTPREMWHKFDSMDSDAIRAAVITHRSPKADLKGKSSVYLESRFDTMAESVEGNVEVRNDFGRAALFGSNRSDGNEPTNPAEARRAFTEKSRELWKQPLSQSKK